MERAVEIFAGINLIAVGLSHALRPKSWGAFFELLHSKGAPGNFINAFLALGMGSIIVAFHNVWSGLAMILTLYGWVSVAKATLYLVFPEIGVKGLEKGATLDDRKWVIAGLVLILIGACALLFPAQSEPSLSLTIPG